MSRMRMLATVALLSCGAVSLAPGVGAGVCVPSEDRGAQPVPGATSTYYLRTFEGPGYTFVQLWQETNNVAGLQYGATMSCTGWADRYVQGSCLGICPIPF